LKESTTLVGGDEPWPQVFNLRNPGMGKLQTRPHEGYLGRTPSIRRRQAVERVRDTLGHDTVTERRACWVLG
jgi:hypothetical protein